MSKRISYTIEGTVQGVNFRSWTTNKANGLNVTGFVKNADDGSVVGEAQGTASSLEKFVQHLNIGPSAAKVSKVDQKDISTKDGESSFEQHDALVAQFQTNVFGPINLTRAMLPHFRKRDRGTIVVMSSIGYMVHAPGAGAYMASKAAVDSLFGTLSLELQSTGIRTLILQPGSYRTDIISPAKMETLEPGSEPYKEFTENIRGELTEAHGKQPGDPVKLAKIVVDMVSAGNYEGRELPTRLVFGSDAVEIGKSIQSESLKIMEEWESVSKLTDVKE